ncbi:MAG: TIM barrel protein [Victivallaceae bacterium]|nr:TIM barrel protein [Victivallaceae bacterium]
MTRIAILADLHLPDDPTTCKEEILQWALAKAKEQGASWIVGGGDLLGMGTLAGAKRLRKYLEESAIPFLLTAGNAELRTPKESEEVARILATAQQTDSVILLDSSVGRLSPEARRLLRELHAGQGRGRLAVTHCPPEAWPESDYTLLQDAYCQGLISHVVAGHVHVDRIGEFCDTVRGLDPDKAVGDVPGFCIYEQRDRTFFREEYCYEKADPRTWEEAARYDLLRHLGISGMGAPLVALQAAAELKIEPVELRWKSIVHEDQPQLEAAIDNWRRKVPGALLSVHLPDLYWGQDGPSGEEELIRAVAWCTRKQVARVTLHVPRMPISAWQDPSIREKTVALMKKLITPLLEAGQGVGIENLHMTPGECDNSDRKFGYTIAECDELIRMLDHPRVGFHFDLGHARNNAPFASREPISSYLAALGGKINGCHLHQVTLMPDGSMENHTPLTTPFGKLISLSSLFLAWQNGTCKHAPLFLEVRSGGTLKSYLALKDFFDCFMKQI